MKLANIRISNENLLSSQNVFNKFIFYGASQFRFCLTLKWSRHWALPLVVKGVPMDPNSENAFPDGSF